MGGKETCKWGEGKDRGDWQYMESMEGYSYEERGEEESEGIETVEVGLGRKVLREGEKLRGGFRI